MSYTYFQTNQAAMFQMFCHTLTTQSSPIEKICPFPATIDFKGLAVSWQAATFFTLLVSRFITIRERSYEMETSSFETGLKQRLRILSVYSPLSLSLVLLAASYVAIFL